MRPYQDRYQHANSPCMCDGCAKRRGTGRAGAGDAVRRELSEAAIATRAPSKHVTMPNGHKVIVPDHEARERVLRQRESKLAGDILDRIDREEGSYAAVLPAHYAQLPWHGDWLRHRRDYILTGDVVSLDSMRGYVTMDNPPLASDVVPVADLVDKRPRGLANRDSLASKVCMFLCVVIAVFMLLWALVSILWQGFLG